MRYATIDSTGAPTGFYDERIAARIPDGAVKIPDAVWRQHIKGAPQRYSATAKTWKAVQKTPAEKIKIKASERKAALAAEYATALAAGVTYDAALFQSAAVSIAALNDTLTALANGWSLPAGFAWIDATDTPHLADVAWLQGLAAAFADHKTALFTRLQAAKQAIAAAKTVAAINKITL